MARTIRRTKEKRRYKSGSSHLESDYLMGWIRMGTAFIRAPLEGDERIKMYNLFHGDSHSSYGWSNPKYSRYESHMQLRVRYKDEISKYIKNEDYEIPVIRIRCLSWDR